MIHVYFILTILAAIELLLFLIGFGVDLPWTFEIFGNTLTDLFSAQNGLIAAGGCLLYLIPSVWYAYRDDGWNGLRRGWKVRLVRGGLIAFSWMSVLFLLHLFYTLPHEIQRTAESAIPPLLSPPMVTTAIRSPAVIAAVAGKISETGNVVVDCRYQAMPTSIPEGHFYTLSPLREDPEDGIGFSDHYLPKRVTQAKWRGDGKPVLGYRCEVTDYFPKAFLNVQMSLHMVFREAVVDSQNRLDRGRVTTDRQWSISISKLDPGPTGSFAFYVVNCCVDRFILIDPPDTAVAYAQPNSFETTISVIKSEGVFPLALYPVSLSRGETEEHRALDRHQGSSR